MTNDETQEEILRDYVSGRATRAQTMQCLGLTWYGELLALIEQCGMHFQRDPVRWDAMVNEITEAMRAGEMKGGCIAIGDVGPLVHLARSRSLDTLLAFGPDARVVVTDFALFDAERHSARCDDAAGIREFLHSISDRVNVQVTTTGSNHKALVVLAERGALNADLAASLVSVRRDSTPDLGELALIEVLRNLAGNQGNDLVLVLVEDDYEPHYPIAGRGRRPYPLEAMLRVHLRQNWFALSDPAMEEALYEIASLRNFAGLDLSEPIPDETTILHFRHMLEE